MLPPRRTVTSNVWVISYRDIVCMTLPWSSGSKDVCPVMTPAGKVTVVRRRDVFATEQDAEIELGRRRICSVLAGEAC